MDPPVETWGAVMRAALARRAVTLAERVEVVAETPSTQDAARAMAGPRAGLLVMAGRQTAGRGRFSRAWEQGGGLGLAMTLAIDERGLAAAHVALAAGVALVRGIGALVPAGGARVGLRWPNDAVETGRGRKLAGVLIEKADGLYFVGFGVNVHQHASDWSASLRAHAASVAELGGSAHRPDTAVEVLRAFQEALALSPEALAHEWRRHDVLVGRAATFAHDGRTTTGIVDSIDPAHSIVLRLTDGTAREIPAAAASLVTDSDRGAISPRPSPPA